MRDEFGLSQPEDSPAGWGVSGDGPLRSEQYNFHTRRSFSKLVSPYEKFGASQPENNRI